MKVECFLLSFIIIIIIISELAYTVYFGLLMGQNPQSGWGSEKTKVYSRDTPESLGMTQ